MIRAHTTLRCVAVAALAFAACRRPGGAVTAAPDVLVVSHDAAAPAPQSPPIAQSVRGSTSLQTAASLEGVRERHFAEAAYEWGRIGARESVIALVLRTRHGHALSWCLPHEASAPAARSVHVGVGAVTAVEFIDVLDQSDAPGPEIIIASQGTGAVSSTSVFSLPPSSEALFEHRAASAALDGARDAAAIRARLPLQRRRSPSELAAVTPVAFFAQLALGDVAALRSTLRASGVSWCSQSLEEGEPVERRACPSLTRDGLTDAAAAEIHATLQRMFAADATLSCGGETPVRCTARWTNDAEAWAVFDLEGGQRVVIGAGQILRRPRSG